MGCKDFFEANKDNKQKCKLLQAMPEATLIEWESEKASDHSPEPVQNAEILYHQILNPTNLTSNKDGLNPTSFDTATGVGMSANRIAHADIDKLIQLGKNRAQAYNEKFPDSAQPRSLWGFVKIPVANARAIISKVTNTRGLFVFDTATPEDDSHADICQGAKDQKNIRSVRLDLYDLVKGSAFQLQQPEE